MSVEAHAPPPEETVLDFDVTNDSVHGNQVGRAFHSHCNQRCFLPLHVFVGDHPLASCMQRASINYIIGLSSNSRLAALEAPRRGMRLRLKQWPAQ